jgi:LmbE family N-acetylglucosaminyl deacetylase
LRPIATTKSLLLSPHNDDETLFASFTICRWKPLVVVCLKSQIQADRGGPTASVRERETSAAMQILGVPWKQIQEPDVDPDWGKVGDAIEELTVRMPNLERIFAPAREDGGHEQHSAIAELAYELFGAVVESYLTYRRGHGKSTGAEVPFEPEWAARKLRALACYRSQIEVENTRSWFVDSTLREYVPA